MVAATRYGTGLDLLVGHLGVLGPDDMPAADHGEEALPGFRFVGYTIRPGLTRYGAVLGRRAARQITGRKGKTGGLRGPRPVRGRCAVNSDSPPWSRVTG